MTLKTNMLLRPHTLIFTLAFSSSVVAVEPASYITDSGIEITPIIKSGYKVDNNIFSQESNTRSSGIFTIAPRATFLLDDGVNNYQLDVGVESGTFIDSPNDDYVTGDVAFISHLESSSRSRFDIALVASAGLEPRGTGLTEGIGDIVEEPFIYNEQSAELTYEYGGLASSGRIKFMGRYYNKNYNNFEEVTQYRNFDESTLGSTFFYSTNSRLDALIELKGRVITYDATQTVSLDSTVYSTLVGLTWEATALTSGTFKIGQEQKNFSDSSRENFKGLSWQGNVEWKPLTYSTITVNTSRSTLDPNRIGDYLLESVYGASWQHAWNEKIISTISYSYVEGDYSGVYRVDETNNLAADISYQFKRWLGVALFVEYTDKDSTNETIIFDKNIVGLNFVFSL